MYNFAPEFPDVGAPVVFYVLPDCRSNPLSLVHRCAGSFSWYYVGRAPGRTLFIYRLRLGRVKTFPD